MRLNISGGGFSYGKPHSAPQNPMSVILITLSGIINVLQKTIITY